MGGILVYALHDDEGNFNKNSLGAVSEGAFAFAKNPAIVARSSSVAPG